MVPAPERELMADLLLALAPEQFAGPDTAAQVEGTFSAVAMLICDAALRYDPVVLADFREQLRRAFARYYAFEHEAGALTALQCECRGRILGHGNHPGCRY